MESESITSISIREFPRKGTQLLVQMKGGTAVNMDGVLERSKGKVLLGEVSVIGPEGEAVILKQKFLNGRRVFVGSVLSDPKLFEAQIDSGTMARVLAGTKDGSQFIFISNPRGEMLAIRVSEAEGEEREGGLMVDAEFELRAIDRARTSQRLITTFLLITATSVFALLGWELTKSDTTVENPITEQPSK